MNPRLFLDLDGTVYLSGRIIDHADIELTRVASLGANVHYMTNNTSYSSDEYAKKLSALNLPLGEQSVITPTIVLAQWLRSQRMRSVFAVGTDAFRTELESRADVTISDQNPDCVIVAFDRELTYEKLATACGLINRGIPWYLTHIDLACPSDQGPIPDCGAIGRLVQATTGVEPAGHFGKPGELMLGYIRELLQPGDTPIVAGDRVYTDAQVGLQLGAETVLVCSGEFKPGTQALDSRVRVHRTLASYLRTLLTYQ